MNREEATRLLLGQDSRSRLRAARWFSRHSEPRDLDSLRRAFDLGSDYWTQDAIRLALANLQPATADAVGQPEETTDGESPTDEIYSEAVEETAGQLVHELEPVVGVLKVFARKEIPDFDRSQTSVHLSRLERLITAIDNLRRAAAPANITEVDLPEVIERVADETTKDGIDISYAGPRPFMVLSDRALVELALVNGLRNALEATLAVEGEKAPIVVAWGDSQKDYWVTVLDEGVGLRPGRSASVFEIGATSKQGHLGMGLALAKQAVTSLRGEVSLRPRSPRGAAYKFSWPKSIRR